jgi:hypothetical protein
LPDARAPNDTHAEVNLFQAQPALLQAFHESIFVSHDLSPQDELIFDIQKATVNAITSFHFSFLHAQ